MAVGRIDIPNAPTGEITSEDMYIFAVGMYAGSDPGNGNGNGNGDDEDTSPPLVFVFRGDRRRKKFDQQLIKQLI
jgi:hypothetical protein